MILSSHHSCCSVCVASLLCVCSVSVSDATDRLERSLGGRGEGLLEGSDARRLGRQLLEEAHREGGGGKGSGGGGCTRCDERRRLQCAVIRVGRSMGGSAERQSQSVRRTDRGGSKVRQRHTHDVCTTPHLMTRPVPRVSSRPRLPRRVACPCLLGVGSTPTAAGAPAATTSTRQMRVKRRKDNGGKELKKEQTSLMGEQVRGKQGHKLVKD